MVTTTFASPLGEILLAADGRGLTGLWFEEQEHFGSTLLREDSEHVEGADAVSGTGGMSSVSPANGAASSVLERSWAWLNAYFAGQEPRFKPISIIVPGHRVVAADGSLNGYAGGLDRKEWLLRLEGAYEE